MSRTEEIADFLAAEGWGAAVRTPLAGDASARRYERLRDGSRRAILMDAPPESGLALAPFIGVTGWLRGAGFSAPEIRAADPGLGLMLLEDLGDALLHRLCAETPSRAPALYAAAIDVLADLHATPPPAGDADWRPPPYDLAFLLREARLMLEWYVPAATGAPTGAAVAAEYEARVAAACAGVASAREAAVYRDFHAENLLWLPARSGRARIGLLDYQDLLVGHPAYDVASLVHDARRDVAPDLAAATVARYAARRGMDPDALGRDIRILSAQRNLKILGLFTRLCRRDGKPRYLAFLPRVWRLLQDDIRDPALADLRAWVERCAPAPDAGVLERIAGAAA